MYVAQNRHDEALPHLSDALGRAEDEVIKATENVSRTTNNLPHYTCYIPIDGLVVEVLEATADGRANIEVALGQNTGLAQIARDRNGHILPGPIQSIEDSTDDIADTRDDAACYVTGRGQSGFYR